MFKGRHSQMTHSLRQLGLTGTLFIVGCTALVGCHDDPAGILPTEEPTSAHVAQTIAIADLNGDSANDIALGYTVVGREGYSNGFASVILGTPSVAGGFQRSVDSELGLSNVPWSLVAADLDGAGTDDLAIALGANGIRLYRHDDSALGVLTRATNIAYVGVPFGMAAGDLNGDGAIDIVATGSDRAAADALVVFWQDPMHRGTFVISNDVLPTANNATGVAIADMNGDGRLDLVASSSSGANAVISIHLQADTPGTFLSPIDFATGASPEFLALADLNADGHIDVAVANRSADAATSLTILLQDSTQPSALLAPVSYPTAPRGTALAVGDVNGDHRIDVVVTHVRDDGRGTVSILLQSDLQIGTFLPATSQPVNCSPRDVAVEDMNRDQLPDIVLACGERATLLFNTPGMPGVFAPPAIVGR